MVSALFLPSINSLWLCSHAARGRPPIEKVHKRMLMDALYEFGPLPINKPRSLFDIKSEFEAMNTEGDENKGSINHGKFINFEVAMQIH